MSWWLSFPRCAETCILVTTKKKNAVLLKLHNLFVVFLMWGFTAHLRGVVLITRLCQSERSEARVNTRTKISNFENYFQRKAI